jgi:hypothetical protein
VTVVVDFPSGGAATGCALGNPGTGIDALQKAGFNPVGNQYGLAFVCRIDNQPATADCGHTAPANAYWSYWHATPGGSWSYSGQGAMSYYPKAGSVDGWAFGAGAAPSIAPPALIADPPPPPPAPPATTRATTANQPPAGSPTTTGVEVGNTSASVTTGVTTSVTTPASTPSTTSPPVAQAPAPPARFPYGLVAGVALVVVLGGVAGFTAWRRRRQPSG